MSQIEYNYLTHKNPEHKDIFVVDWCLSSVCNYKCSYCPENLHDHLHPFPEPEPVIEFLNKVIEHYRDKTPYFQFTGGEVSLWKGFPKVLEALGKTRAKVGIISNGSRALRWWEKHIESIDMVNISFHAEQGDPEHFLRVIKFIADKTSVHCNVMMHPEHFELCKDLWLELRNIAGIGIAQQTLLKDFKDIYESYTSEQLEFISNQYSTKRGQKDNPNRFSFRSSMGAFQKGEFVKEFHSHVLINDQMNNWQGWKCSIGREQIVVDFKGDIYRGWCIQGGFVGSVYDLENVKLLTKDIICERSFYHCNLDIMCTKEKVNEVEQQAYQPAPHS